MAVLSVNPRYSWRGISDERNDTQYSREYLIETDNRNDGPRVIIDSGLLPAKFSPYVQGNDNDPNALVKSYDFRYLQDKEHDLLWSCTVNWSSRFDFDAPNWNENPLLRPARYDSGILLNEEFPLQDFEGNAYINAAKDKLRNRPPRLVPTPWIRCTKNVAVQDWTLLISHAYTINQAPFLGFARGEVLIADLAYSQEFWENNTVYYTLTIEFHIKRTEQLEVVDPLTNIQTTTQVEGHWLKVLNAGPNEAGSGSVGKAPFSKVKDRDYRTVDGLVALDKDGAPIASPSSSNITYMIFRENRYSDFGLLPI